MLNSILPQNQGGQVLFTAISLFFSMFKISDLLKKSNARKEKGVPVLSIFKYKLCKVFSDRSMYMQQKTGTNGQAVRGLNSDSGCLTMTPCAIAKDTA